MQGREFAKARERGFKTPRATKRALRQYEPSRKARTANKLISIEREKDADDQLKQME